MSVTCYANPACQPPVLGSGVHSAPPQIVHNVTNATPLVHLTGPLPFTGADIVELAMIGLAMVVVGYFTVQHEKWREQRELP